MNTEFQQESMKTRRINRAVAISAELFLKHGIDSIKMTYIADESGVGVATLYRYFSTKTGIAIAAMTHLWNELNNMFAGVFESKVFLAQSGLKQLSDMMRMYIVLYDAHKDFMKLLGEFDLLMIKEKVPKSKLQEYDQSIINFYRVYDGAVQRGIADGSLREDVDYRLLYLTYCHAMMELTKKFLRGEILPSDSFSEASKELGMFVDIAVEYVRKR